jgi:prepilin-type N-terminal cleavage/methylation domain-containing protein
MKKITKNKGGFTLIETILVIAIIAILMNFLIFSISDYISRAHNAYSSLSEHNDNIQAATEEIEDAM